MNIKKQVGTLLSAVALTIGVASVAQAGALAVSVVKFENFTISKASTGVQLDLSDLGSLSFTGDADATANLNGVFDNDAGSSNTIPPASIDTYASVGNPAPFYADNAFTPLSVVGGLPAGRFAVADTFETGAPITGLGVTANADLFNASYVSLGVSGEGSSQSNNGLQSTITFTAGFSDALRFDYDLSFYLESFLGLGDRIKASAGFDVQFRLIDLASPFVNLIPAGSAFFSLNNSAPSPGDGIPYTFSAPGTFNVTGIGTSFTTIAPLVAGNRYQLTADINTVADAAFIPEPGVVALMGLGLLGIASFRRRNAKNA